MFSGRVSSSCSTSDTRRVTVKRHEPHYKPEVNFSSFCSTSDIRRVTGKQHVMS